MELRFTDEGEGVPVLFLHASPYHRGAWEGQRAALRGKARFLSLDARGVGVDAPVPSAFMLEQLVDDAIALLDQRGIERAVLCGCSLGGYIALRLAERAPDRVRALLLVDTQAAAESDEAKLARAAGLRMLAQDGKSAFAAAQLKRQLSPHTPPDTRARLARLIEDSSSEGIAAVMVALATRTDVSASLAKIAVPTSLIVGADDTITTPAIMRRVTEQIAGATLHVIERAGHVPNLEAEPEFNAVLLQLLGRLA
jgi:pimeloyl-ACP methyl ester carboxylesterase